MLGINVLVIVGSCESSFSGTLAEVAGENSPDGIRVSVFDCLDELPPFSETAASVELPALRGCIAESRRCGRCGAARDALLRACTRDRAQRHRLADDALEWQ